MPGDPRPNGLADNSPRGDAPGFVQVLGRAHPPDPRPAGQQPAGFHGQHRRQPERRPVVPDPGRDRDPARQRPRPDRHRGDLLAGFEVRGRAPKAAILVEVAEAFLHCSKALIRARLWEADAKVDRKVLPTLGRMIADVVDQKTSPETVTEYDQQIARNIEEQLY